MHFRRNFHLDLIFGSSVTVRVGSKNLGHSPILLWLVVIIEVALFFRDGSVWWFFLAVISNTTKNPTAQIASGRRGKIWWWISKSIQKELMRNFENTEHTKVKKDILILRCSCTSMLLERLEVGNIWEMKWNPRFQWNKEICREPFGKIRCCRNDWFPKLNNWNSNRPGGDELKYCEAIVRYIRECNWEKNC